MISFTVSEKGFRQQVIELARLNGWLCYSTFSFRSNTKNPGFPDLVMVRNREVIFAELKAENRKVTRAQQEWLDTLKATGVVKVYLWKPSDWESIVVLLNGKEEEK